jgi:hypothetical protein
VAARLRAIQVTAILTSLQRGALDRGQLKEAELLRALLVWQRETSALASAADRQLEAARCEGCGGQVQLPGELADLIARVRLPAEEPER